MSERACDEDGSRARFLAAALEAAGQGAWQWKPGKGFTRLSPRCLDLLRGGPADPLSAVHPEDRAGLYERIGAALELRGELDATLRILEPDGSLRALRALGRFEAAEDGDGPGLVGLLQPHALAGRGDASDLAPVSFADLAMIVDSIPHHVWIRDANFDVVFLNRPFQEYLGTYLGPGSDLVHPDDLQAVIEARRRIAAGQPAAPFEARLRRTDGTHRWFELRMAALRDGSGGIRGWVGTHTDVEQARQLRSALAREEQRYQQSAALAPGVLYEAREEPDGRVSFPVLSARAEEVLGVPADQLARTARAFGERIHPADLGAMHASLASAVEAASDWRFAFRYLHPPGQERWLECHASHTPLPEGGRTWHGRIDDVTDLRRSEAALRTSRGQLMAALNAGAMGSWSCDLVTGRVEADETARAFWGLQRADEMSIGNAGFGFVDPEDRDRVAAQFSAAAEAGFGPIAPYRIEPPEAAARWISTYLVATRDSENRVRWVSGVHVDVTERRRADESALQSQKLEALGRLAGGIAHDFNNVLTAIYGNAELIESMVEPEHPAAEAISEIQRASERAAALVRQILAFSRPELTRKQVVALGPVVQEGLRMLRATLPASLKLSAEIPGDLPPVMVDATHVHQVLVNLVTNAGEAIGVRPGRVEVELRSLEIGAARAQSHPALAPGRWVVLSVRDDGAGMTRATRARAFDPFFTTRRGGTGLGLATVHRIVTAHGGAIEVESEPDAGATFRVWLPAAVESSAEPDTVAEGVPVVAARRRVLFVDDEPSIVALADRALRRLGYEVTGCSEARQALDLLRVTPLQYDALVTDSAMPGLTGFELVRSARALHPQLPVLMQSGNVRSEDQSQAAALGIDELLQKPCSAKRIAAAIERAIGEGGMAVAPE